MDTIKFSGKTIDPRDAIRFDYNLVEVAKKRPGVLCTVEGPFQRADVKNANDRVYPREILANLFKSEKFKESLTRRRMVGMLRHPASGQTDPELISHVVTKQELMSDGIVNGAADILDLPSGRIAETLFRAGVEFGVSSRGDGTLKKKGGALEVQDDLWISTYDLVLDPSVDIAYPKIVENAVKNNKLVADAIAGLVEGDLPEETRVAILMECLKILGVLEGVDSGDNVTKLSKYIQEALKGKAPTTLVIIEASDPVDPNGRTVEETMSSTSSPAGTPIPGAMQAVPGVITPDTLSWHHAELKKAVDAANSEKDDEIDDLRKESIEGQKEHRELKQRYDAAKEVIEDLHRKVESNDDDDGDYETLKERYDAAVDLLNESIKELKTLGEAKRRVETLESLLDSSLKKLMRERRDVAIKESLAEAPAEFHDTMRPVLEESTTPDQVAETFKRLMALKTGKPIAKEPLPEGSDNPKPGEKKPAPVVESAHRSFAQMLGSKMNRI